MAAVCAGSGVKWVVGGVVEWSAKAGGEVTGAVTGVVRSKIGVCVGVVAGGRSSRGVKARMVGPNTTQKMTMAISQRCLDIMASRNTAQDWFPVWPFAYDAIA